MNVTYEQLFHLHTNRQALTEYLMQPKIRQFYNDNGIRIDTMIDKRNKLMKDFFVMDGDKVRFETIPAIPKIDAVYKTEHKVIKKGTWFRSEVSEKHKIMVSDEIPATSEQKIPVMIEGKTMEQYDKAMEELNKFEITIK